MVIKMKRFKSKKKSNNLIIYIGLFLLSVSFSVKFLYDKDLINNDTLIDLLISDNLGSLEGNISDVDFLLKYALNIDLENGDAVLKSDTEMTPLEVENTPDTFNIDKEIPLVYIYNSHQEEKYQSGILAPYNINPTVLMASKMLKEYLATYGINVLVEEENVAEKLKSLNLKYGSSYKVSRMFLESAYEKNNTLKYFIDLHRDSSKYENTTTDIDGEKYAKLLMVVGLDNPNYEPNLALAEKLKEKITAYNPNLFRGIMKKSGKGVNGVYNQDFNENVMLIEVGGQYNNISEVNNTLKVLAKILSDFIKEDLNEKKEN